MNHTPRVVCDWCAQDLGEAILVAQGDTQWVWSVDPDILAHRCKLMERHLAAQEPEDTFVWLTNPVDWKGNQ